MSLRDTGRLTAARDLDPALRRMASRQRWGGVNRRLGWVILPIVVTASVVHYLFGGDEGTLNSVVLALQYLFVPLVALHAALSFYVFGWVPPSRRISRS